MMMLLRPLSPLRSLRGLRCQPRRARGRHLAAFAILEGDPSWSQIGGARARERGGGALLALPSFLWAIS